MHSREKLKKYYPQVDDELLQKLYGVSSSRNTKEFWNRLVISKLASKFASRVAGWEGTENINLTEFYKKTTPKYLIPHCMFEHIDCRALWQFRSKIASNFNSINFSHQNGIMLGV